MTKRAILALIDPSAPDERAIDAALAYARIHGTALTLGLVAAVPVPGGPTYPAHLTTQHFNELLEAKEQQLWARARSGGCEVRTFIDPVDTLLDAIVRASRCFDLLLIGSTGSVDRDLRLTLIETLLLHAGKPLVLLSENALEHCPRKIVVAWDGGAEASVALDRALEWVDPEARFNLVSVLPMNSPLPLRTEPDDMCARLIARGHDAAASITHRDHLTTAAALLARAVAEGADLLVLGGFGHSRLREDLLGGVSHEIIRGEHTLPVLIAH